MSQIAPSAAARLARTATGKPVGELGHSPGYPYPRNDIPRLLPPTRAQWLDECLIEATERAYELRVHFRNGEVVAQFFNHDYPCYTRRFQVGGSR